MQIHFFVQFSKTIRKGGGHNLLKFDMTSNLNQEFFEGQSK